MDYLQAQRLLVNVDELRSCHDNGARNILLRKVECHMALFKIQLPASWQ